MSEAARPVDPHAWLKSRGRWSVFEIAFWLATLTPFFLFQTYLPLGSQIAIAALFAPLALNMPGAPGTGSPVCNNAARSSPEPVKLRQTIAS